MKGGMEGGGIKREEQIQYNNLQVSSIPPTGKRLPPLDMISFGSTVSYEANTFQLTNIATKRIFPKSDALTFPSESTAHPAGIGSIFLLCISTCVSVQ